MAEHPSTSDATRDATEVLRRAGLTADVIQEGKTVGELSSPRQGDIVKPSELVGHLLIVRPTEFCPEVVTAYGKNDAVRVDIADLNANGDDGSWGVIYRDALWFNRQLLGLRKQIGENVCAWMAQGVGKPGQDPPFMLTDAATNADAARVAQDWLNRHPEFEANGNPTQMSAPAPATQMPLPGVSAPAPATGGQVPAPPAPAAPAPPASTQMPLPGASPAAGNAALASLSAEQKAALQALGFPVG